MAYTLDQYNTLVAAIASGAKFVKYDDKEVEYQSLTDMQSIKSEMEEDLGLKPKARRKWSGQYSKGIR